MPGAGNSIESHIGGGVRFRTQWISTTKSEAIALARFGKNGIVIIDLDKVPGLKVDCSLGIPGSNNANLNAYAISVQELVIQGHVPPEAITPHPLNPPK
jgi:hypothetical protein